MTNNVEDQPSNISAGFVLFDPVVISEEELICEVQGQDDDRQKVMTTTHLTLWAGKLRTKQLRKETTDIIILI